MKHDDPDDHGDPDDPNDPDDHYEHDDLLVVEAGDAEPLLDVVPDTDSGAAVVEGHGCWHRQLVLGQGMASDQGSWECLWYQNVAKCKRR